MSKMVKARILVEGRVQGVGFRYFVKATAVTSGVKGLVRNLEDGRVEIFCDCVSRERLEEFVKKISVKSGYGFGLGPHVEKVLVFGEGEKGFAPAWQRYEGFEITH